MGAYKYEQIRSAVGKLSKPFIAAHVNGVHRMACCDCGLVHDMKFTAALKKFSKAGKLIGYIPFSQRYAVVMVAAGRNERATAGRRRAAKVKAKIKSLQEK